MIFHYDTLRSPSTGSFHDSGSKFLAYAFPAGSREDVDGHLTALRREHPRARHHCYAYRILSHDEITEFASDAGEPSGSAGQPILGELKRNGLVNVCVIVVRYFGGTKLGIPGLINAYRESTHQAISAGQMIPRKRTVRYRAIMPISLQPIFYAACKQYDITIGETQYGDSFSAEIEVPMMHADAMLHQLVSRIAGTDGPMEQICEMIGLRMVRM